MLQLLNRLVELAAILAGVWCIWWAWSWVYPEGDAMRWLMAALLCASVLCVYARASVLWRRLLWPSATMTTPMMHVRKLARCAVSP